ncbi:MAG: 1,4-alpha-glucan branching protein [Phycisphaerae bacterium]|nr:1,4-alpha-glucan branching protein [Phycisphaerae bacterium]
MTPARQRASFVIVAAGLSLLLSSGHARAQDGPSEYGGVGAIPWMEHVPGVAFRVWAPFADAVHVSGGFNNWSATANPLYPEGDGWWSVDVPYLVPGYEYKFVITNQSNQLWRNDPHARQLVNSLGPAIIYDSEDYQWNDQGFSTPYWNQMVIYEMHLGTFGAEGFKFLPGQFSDAIQRLDYLEDLGINAIELMPVCEFPGELSWGYNPAHPYSVESSYGGPDGLKRFVDEAHQRGIAVIMDVVYNHLGPTDLDMWQFDGWSQDGWGGIYFYNDFRAVTAWGDTRPDYGRGEVRSYIRDNAIMWLEEFHMDGLRVDGVQWIRRYGNPPWENGGDLPEGWSLLQWINDEVNALSSWKLIIAEDGANNHWVTKTTGEGGAGFDAQTDSDFVHPVRWNLITPSDSDRKMWEIHGAITHSFNGWHTQRVIYTENHDEVANGHQRLPEEIWPGNAGSWYSKKRSTLGGALVMTTPGIPMIFQGQEFLEDGWFTDEDPLDWNKLDLYSGIHHLYKDLITLRLNRNGNTRGLTGNNVNVFHVNDNDKVIAFHRWMNGGEGDDVVVVMNFSGSYFQDYRIGMPQQGTWEIVFNSDAGIYSDDFSNLPGHDSFGESQSWDGMPFSGLMSIPPYSCLIYSQVDNPPDPPSIPGDLDGDGLVNGVDLAILLGAWITNDPAGDINGDLIVDGTDLGILLGSWFSR